MRALLQRVAQSDVKVDGQTIGEIEKGFLILIGVHIEDTESQIAPLVEKIANLRVFEDQEGRLNLSLRDIQGGVLIVSQFTLYADTKKGRRPSFIDAASPDKANMLYEKFVEEFRKTGLKVETGKFQARMKISLVNDGPVTIMLDTGER